MDVERLRHDAEIYADIGAHERLRQLCGNVLRILNAFEVMERERFSISVEGRGFTCVDKDGNAFTEKFTSPLAALLAAADKLKGASDADSK